ncbi:MAG TPA: biosynthetic-type acetolactate synthase large subunit [Blattabacteriaceae bacterium]
MYRGKTCCGSEILIKSLLDEKVNYVFGYPGGTIMPVYDVMHFMREKYINHILTRHEQGAIHAAQGYSKVSGKVGVCLTSSGPGATNLVTGLSDAMVDSSPIVCISGQVSSSLIGTDAFQEINIIDISLSVTKWNVQVPYAEYIYPTIRKAFYISKIGRPGPVLVDLTKNAQFQRIHFYGGPYGFEKYKKEIIYINKIKKAVELINSATKPFIIFGQGVILANAEEELKKFVEKTGIPFACTLLGLGALDSEHPLFMGMLGMHGNYAPNVLTNKCDVLISIGMRFDDRVTGNINGYTQKASIIHLDIDPCEIDKNIPCILQILGDCKITLPKFTSLVKKKSHGEWLKNFLYLKNKEEKIVLKNDLYPNPKKFTMGEVIHKINQYKKNNAILVTDVGQHQMIASRYFNFSPKRSQVTSGGIGTMGFALPASIGAKIGGKKNRQVICVTGDGSIQMTIQELGTILQSNITVKIVLLNNNFLGMVRQWQQLFFEKRYSYTELVNPNFIKLSRAYGIYGEKVQFRKNLVTAITKMFYESNGPYFLEVIIEKENNVFPIIPSFTKVNEVLLM